MPSQGWFHRQFVKGRLLGAAGAGSIRSRIEGTVLRLHRYKRPPKKIRATRLVERIPSHLIFLSIVFNLFRFYVIGHVYCRV
jgi:hypothetical protein